MYYNDMTTRKGSRKSNCLIKTGRHARIQEFSSGGGGGSGQPGKKKALTTFFFKSSAYFTEVKWSISETSIIFQGSRGVQLFPGGGGVQLLIPYRTPYNL